MTRVSVRHSCGHTQTVQMPGRPRDYPTGAALTERRRCPGCQNPHRRSIPAERAAQRGLPPLTGTKLHIQRALSIRNEKFSAVEAFIRDISRKTPAVQRNRLERQLTSLMALLMTQTEAAWWVDRRTRNARELLKEVDLSARSGNA